MQNGAVRALASSRTGPMPSELLKAKPPSLPRVLIVDDAQGMRAYLCAVLAAVGFDCIEAADGAVAFDAVLAGDIDLVVTDLDMPVMDGFQLIAAIGILPPLARPPIVVVSGLLDETLAAIRPDLRQAAALLAKPVQPDALIRAVNRALGGQSAFA